MEVHAVGRDKDGVHRLYGLQIDPARAERADRWRAIRLSPLTHLSLSVFRSLAPRPDFRLARFQVDELLLVAGTDPGGV